MTRHALIRRAAMALSGVAVLGLASWSQAQPASAMSCFAVAGKVTCIDTAAASGPAFMPPVIVPSADWGDGEDHHIVIEDDGGRHIARG